MLFPNLGHAGDFVADDGDGGGIGCKDRVKTLCLLCRITSVVVAYLPLLLMTWIGIAAPSPKVAASEIAAFLCIVAHERENIAVETVASLCGGVLGEFEAIAGIAEFLHDEWFFEARTDGEMTVDIVFRTVAACLQVVDEVVGPCPRPVVRP